MVVVREENAVSSCVHGNQDSCWRRHARRNVAVTNSRSLEDNPQASATLPAIILQSYIIDIL